MTGKRKRDRVGEEESRLKAPPTGAPKPMSAIAAARLKAQKETAPIPAKHGLQEPPPSPLADSTKSEDAKSEPEDISLIPQNFKLSTWRKTKANVLSDTPQKLTIVLDKHSTASFVGHFDVKILKGAVNINGANLGATSIGSKEREKEYRVFACSTNPIMKIRGLDRTNHVQLRSCPEPTPLADMNPLFANLWGGNAENDKGRSFTGVTESDDDPLKRALVPELTPEDWLRTIDDISATASATFLVGSSMCGKSTFAKRLLNRYVTGFGKTTKPFPAVCYLDLDPSSPEYTTHGQISLTIVRELNLGPGFTHPAAVNHINGNETIAAHAIPHHDLTNYEAYFSTCAEHLFQTYQNLRLDGAQPPLIINTPGSLYTSHFLLIERLLASMKPNHMVHFGDTRSIDEDTAAKLHSLQLRSQKLHFKLHELAAQFPAMPPARSPAESRAMQMAAYFHLTSSTTACNHPIYTSAPLTALAPWAFSYRDTPAHAQDFLAVLPLFDQEIPSSTLLNALNGSIIHIVTSTSPHTHPTPLRTSKSHIPYFPLHRDTHLPPTLSPTTTRLVCTALIRGIDPTTHTFHLFIPPPFESLLHALDPKKTVLVAGCTDTPEWSYMEDAYAQVSQRRRDLGDRARFASDEWLLEGVEKGPWVTDGKVLEGMGYAGAVRRVRRFLG